MWNWSKSFWIWTWDKGFWSRDEGQSMNICSYLYSTQLRASASLFHMFHSLSALFTCVGFFYRANLNDRSCGSNSEGCITLNYITVKFLLQYKLYLCFFATAWKYPTAWSNAASSRQISGLGFTLHVYIQHTYTLFILCATNHIRWVLDNRKARVARRYRCTRLTPKRGYRCVAVLIEL